MKYDFMNFPEAIPEEVFVYFGNKKDMKDLESMAERDLMLNMHFYQHYHSVLEQREEKEVYMAHGFT